MLGGPWTVGEITHVARLAAPRSTIRPAGGVSFCAALRTCAYESPEGLANSRWAGGTVAYRKEPDVDGSRGVEDKLLTVGEAAALLGTTDRFPRRLIAERRISFVRIGRAVRIRRSVLDDFIRTNTVESRSDR